MIVRTALRPGPPSVSAFRIALPFIGIFLTFVSHLSGRLRTAVWVQSAVEARTGARSRNCTERRSHSSGESFKLDERHRAGR